MFFAIFKISLVLTLRSLFITFSVRLPAHPISLILVTILRIGINPIVFFLFITNKVIPIRKNVN